jgi:uncharacterized Tic20 family protein
MDPFLHSNRKSQLNFTYSLLATSIIALIHSLQGMLACNAVAWFPSIEWSQMVGETETSGISREAGKACPKLFS